MKNTRYLIGICFSLLVALLLVLTFDLWESCTRYLYFTTEIGIALLCACIYFVALGDKKWNSPPERSDQLPRPQWQSFCKELFAGFAGLIAALMVIWIVYGITERISWHIWLKRGAWFGYYVGIFVISIFIISRYIKYVHATALVTSTVIMVFFLCFYEMLLLAHGTGWEYHQTVIGWLLGVPIDNILFIYPVAPALAMMFYAMATRHMNNLKAFWVVNGILAPCSIIVELIGIYPLNLWRTFNDGSILPMGKTNLEEFIYYFLFQFMAIALYVFFADRFSREVET